MTKKWRLVITTSDLSDAYSGYIPGVLRAIAEGHISETAVLFKIDRPAVFLQRYCDVLRDVNYEACIENNVKISRGITAAGGVMYGETGTEMDLIIGWDKNKHPELPSQPDLILMKVLGVFADVMSDKYKIPMRYRPLNDMEVWDSEKKIFRKVMGTGASGLFTAVGMGWVPQSTKPSELMYEVLASPVEKYADKILKDVRERGWSLEEAGAFPKGLDAIENIRENWVDIFKTTFKKAFNIEFEEGELTDIELKYIEEFKNMFQSEQHIFARSAEKKFEEIPSGTSLGRAFLKIPGGPLIRAYVLRENDTIKDIMFTGTMHMTPGDALEKLEQSLIGMKIDQNAINAKVEEWSGTGVTIGMLEAPQLTGIINEAIKLSYEESG